MRSRRNVELFGIGGAAAITAGAYALASLGRNATMPADLLPFFAVLPMAA